ncbi:MAG: preprotein translocase subunit SecG [Kiritimatiellae bacterium]|nr:preprotein translocase subunit SecG [Kiritimatiellia bacterium]
MIILLYIVEVLLCLLLAGVVMLQKPKEGGLGGAFGGGALEASLGADAGNILIKATTWIGALFLINTLILAKMTVNTGSVTDEGDGQTQQQQQSGADQGSEGQPAQK